MVVHAHKPNNWEADQEDLLVFWGQPGLQRFSLIQTNKQTKNNDTKPTRRPQRLRASPEHGCFFQLFQTFPPKAGVSALEETQW